MSQEPSRVLGKRLAIFRDVIKVAFLTSAVANSPKSLSILPENTSDLKTLKVGPWVKDIILLFDLGFYKYQLFGRIVENGGFFVSRLKSNAN